MFHIISSQSHDIKFSEIEFVLYNHSPLFKTQVGHALEGVNACNPGDLLRGEDSHPALSLFINDKIASAPPSLNDFVLSAQFDPCPPEDLCCRQLGVFIVVKAPMPEKDHQGLHLLRMLLSHSQAMVFGPLAP